MEKEQIVMHYISIWAWHIIAVIMLCSSIIIISIGIDLINVIFFIAFILGFLTCETISYARRKEIYDTKVR